MAEAGITAANAKTMSLEEFLLAVINSRDSYLSTEVTLNAETKNPILQLRQHRLGSIGFEVSGDTLKVVTYTPKPPKEKPTEADHCCAVCHD